MKMTSLSHPLRISAVSAGNGCGAIGITFCPGKYDPAAMSGYWERDLGCDLDAVRAWGAVAVVTLLEPAELVLLRVEQLGDAVRSREMRWFHLPICDATTPGPRFEKQWATAGVELRAILRRGGNVLVHCRGGLGRAGTVAARLLVELGMTPEAAVREVRMARPGAIETGTGQYEYVLALHGESP